MTIFDRIERVRRQQVRMILAYVSEYEKETEDNPPTLEGFKATLQNVLTEDSDNK